MSTRDSSEFDGPDLVDASFRQEEGSGETRTSGVMPRARLDSWRVPRSNSSAPRSSHGSSKEAPQEAELEPMSPSDVAMGSTELARVLGMARDENELATAFVTVLSRTLPRRLIALRLEAEGAPAIATNAGVAPSIFPLRISRAGAELFALEKHVEVHEEHTPVCPGADHGFDLPVLLEGRLLGALSIEYAEGSQAPSGELAPLLPLLSNLALATASVRVRRERDAERRQVAELVKHTTLPAFLIDGQGKIVGASEGAAELMHRGVSELLGRSADLIAVDEARSVVLEGLERTGRGETIARLEMRTQRRNGGARVIWTAVPARDADGRTRTTLCVGEDLTDVTRLEDQILHAEKLATLGQLAAGVVHELNNPLTSISVYTDYLLQKGKRTGGDPADVERLGRIAEAAARMLRFTRDLVTYARPSTEEPSAVPIAEVLAQSAGFCEHVLRDAQVTLTLRASTTLPPVRGLRGQLQQVFVNLFTNAAHAIAETQKAGNIVVVASVDREHVLVEVGDDGPGIRAEHRGKIFEPFFSTKAEGKGTGLGLSIVRNIVRLHGGSIEIESQHAESQVPTTGTRFLVRLPLFFE